MHNPYRTETADEARHRRLDDFAAWQAETARAEMLSSADAATLRGMLTDHVAEEPATEAPARLGAFDAAHYRKRAARRHDEWREELDTLARAYVAALDREAVQLPLRLEGVAR